MSSDPLERNLGDLIRHGALPPDDDRTARARRRFLDGIAAPPERTSWKIAAAAASLLVLATIVWSAHSPRPRELAPVLEPPSGVVAILGHGGDRNLEGNLLRLKNQLRFVGRSPLPDGLVFKIRAERLEIQEQGRILRSDIRSSLPGTATLRNGSFDFDWPDKGPGRVRLLVSAQDDLQDTAVSRQLRELGLSDSARQWTFEFSAWDEKMLALLGPQLDGVAKLADELRDLVERVSQACDFQSAFETQKKMFIREAEKLQARAQGMEESGLFPESSRRVGHTARDLAQAMEIFTWKDDKFDGPRSYYTNGEKAKTHRNDPFELATLRKYLDEAVRVGGREFGLWIVDEFRRGGPRPMLAETVKPHERRPGLVDVSDRLKQLVHEFHGVDLAKLDRDLRRLD